MPGQGGADARPRAGGIPLRQRADQPHPLDHLPYNKTSRVACHNCYDPKSPFLFFGQALESTTAVEIDIRPSYVPGRWVVTHASNRLNRNNCGGSTHDGFEADLAVCLRVVRDRVAADSTSEVVTVFVDIKGLKNGQWHEGLGPGALDSVARSVLGSGRILAPGELRQRRSRAGRAPLWPSLGELHGRVVLVLTGNERDLRPYREARGAGALFFTARDADSPEDVLAGLQASQQFFNLRLPFKVEFDRPTTRKTLTAVAEAHGVSRMWAYGDDLFISHKRADRELRGFGACFMREGQLTFLAMYRDFDEMGDDECKQTTGKRSEGRRDAFASRIPR